MVTIRTVDPGSPAEKAGVLAGDRLISINGNNINDVLDYRFYVTESRLTLETEREGVLISRTVKKPEYDDIGLEFETFLMDKKKRCSNKCIFCFIDQNPPGMRESIYFKDDDERLSFLQGNYVTLTNLKQADIDRMIKMRISPVNISVHTTNPELRERMTGNRFAGKSLAWLGQLSDAGLELNLQFVLCRGINDGDELRRSLSDIRALSSVSSAAVVPSGLTAYRDGLEKLVPYDAESASEVLDIVEAENAARRAECGAGVVYASDEFYLLAGRPLPPDGYYDGYPQLENGVGMITDLRESFAHALRSSRKCEPGSLTVATGEAAYGCVSELSESFSAKFPMKKIEVIAVKNEFFGGSVTVSGLLTGGDIIKQLSGRMSGEKLVITCNMLKADEDVFLDGVTLGELSSALGVPVRVVGKDGGDLCAAFRE